jgi:hypothetical protein
MIPVHAHDGDGEDRRIVFNMPRALNTCFAIDIHNNKWKWVEVAESILNKYAKRVHMEMGYKHVLLSVFPLCDEHSFSDAAKKEGVDIIKLSTRYHRRIMSTKLMFFSMVIEAMAMAHYDRESRRFVREQVKQVYRHCNCTLKDIGIIDMSEFGDVVDVNNTCTEFLQLSVSWMVYDAREDWCDLMDNRLTCMLHKRPENADAEVRYFGRPPRRHAPLASPAPPAPPAAPAAPAAP